MHKKIGELLIEKGFVNDEYIRFALKEQESTGERVGEILVRLGIVTDIEVAMVLAEQSGKKFVDLTDFSFDKKVLGIMPISFARQYSVLPLSNDNGTLRIAVSDPFDIRIPELVTRFTNNTIDVSVAANSQIRRLIERSHYLLEHPVVEEINRMVETLKRNENAAINVEYLTELIISSAIINRATDIHITPTNKTMHISYRIDGVLQLFYTLPVSVHPRIVSAIKVSSGMDIAEQRKSQDGRMSFSFAGEKFDLRVSTMLTSFGENVVLRILTRSATLYSMDNLGFSMSDCEKIKNLFKKPFGMIIVCGPTGAGKTTTLYAILRQVNAIEKNVLTVEDPIEYTFPLIRQTQVNVRAGITFASATKHFLRQDPDVMLIGEMRDTETAQIAVRASMTGHLVFSTLHTNDAIGVIPRLLDLGVNNYLIGSSLLGVIAQRLVRKICPYCKEEIIKDGKKSYRGKGCERCNFTGYLGRTAIGEILVVTEKIAQMIIDSAPLYEIKKQAQQEGMTTLLEDAMEKVKTGTTTIEEVERVVGI